MSLTRNSPPVASGTVSAQNIVLRRSFAQAVQSRSSHVPALKIGCIAGKEEEVEQ